MVSDPLEDEIRNMIFCDPFFFEHFLDDDINLRSVLQRCHGSSIYNMQRRQWSFPRTKQGNQSHQSTIRILNTIKLAVDTAMRRTSTSGFVNRACQVVKTDYKLSPLTCPDIILFNEIHEGHEHWENVRLTVSVVRLVSHLKAAIARLAFDARAIFTHQIHRRHLYAFAVCGTEATFVRFDRAGVLYSTPINIRMDSDRFTKAVAALLMLSNDAFGYDTAFSTKMNENQRLGYYLDLPGLNSAGSLRISGRADGKSSIQRFKVVERLCNHGDLIGRATIVIRIRQIKLPETISKELGLCLGARGRKRKLQQSQAEELHDESYVLKLVWRDPTQESEGEVLKQLIGVYGLVQYVWHYDVPRPCRCERVARICSKCLDETAQLDDILVCKDLTNIDKFVDISHENQHNYCSKRIRKFERTTETRERRIYSRILLESVGKPLWAAESLQEVFTGVLDAIMGYWRLANLGIIHRDVSEGNVMLLPRGQKFRRREWKTQPKRALRSLCSCKTMLQEYIERFERDPTGMLCDFDRYIISNVTSKHHSCPCATKSSIKPQISTSLTCNSTNWGNVTRKKEVSCRGLALTGSEARLRDPYSRAIQETPSSQQLDHRVGTVAFMSINVLGIQLGQHYEHTFMDDLESFFWVLLYTVTSHVSSDVSRLTLAASQIIDKMDNDDERVVQRFKISFLRDCRKRPDNIVRTLRAVKNGWASHEAVISALIQLGLFFIDRGEASLHEVTSVEAFPKVVDTLVCVLQKV